MDKETLAEVIVNLHYNPAVKSDWDQAEIDAEEALRAAEAGQIEPWWEDGEN